MKKNFLLLGLWCIINYTYAGNHYGRQYGQNDNQRFGFSFNAGIGFPVSAFGEKDSLPVLDSNYTKADGYAKPGFHFEVGISYRFAKYIGIAGVTGGTICPFDASAYNNTHRLSFAPYQLRASAQGSHYEAEYLIGPFLYIPVSDKFSIEARALFGILSSKYPDITVASTLPNNYFGYTYKFSIGKDFAYYFSVAGKIKLGDNIGVVIMANYLGSSVVYPGLVYTDSTPSGFSYSGFYFGNRSMSLGILSITGGLYISF